MSTKEPPFTYMIGLEIHVELGTQTKMFCRCLNRPFGAEPNQYTCPVCFGLPGTLPVPNKEAVRRAIVVGKALGSSIPKFSKWDRKHYFYPDLPKGYQISQYDLPLCQGGQLELLKADGTPEAIIHFERVHLEEDAGKLLHTSETGYSKVDLNRAGVPLLEMVTKPELTSPEQARRFLQEIRLLMRTLQVSDADMEKGQLRCDVNLSIHFEDEGGAVHTPVTEIKNVNSTRSVERSLKIEAERLYAEWKAGGPIRERENKITAGWDENRERIIISRAKEAAHEYRYFPEPDLPPLKVYTDAELDPERVELPELPNISRSRYLKEGLVMSDIDFLLNNAALRERIEQTVSQTGLPLKEVSKWLVNLPAAEKMSPARLKELHTLVQTGEVSFSELREKLEQVASALVAENAPTLPELLTQMGLRQEHREDVVQLAIAEVLKEQAAAAADYRAGKEKVLGFLVGQVMQKVHGNAQAARVQAALKEALTKSS